MVYTVTLNPALDYTLRLESLMTGSIQRSDFESFYAGGKGINVSNVLTQLQIPNVALGFVAGFTGGEIERLVHALGVKTDFVYISTGTSRINIKIRTAGGTETDINARGCKIDAVSLGEFFRKIDALRDGDYLVLAGSVPNSLSQDIYENVMRRLVAKEINYLVDAEGTLLEKTLKYNPFLIKPNKEELEELLGKTAKDDKDIILFAEELQKEGARNVLVSMGADGAILLAESGQRIKAPAVYGKVVNTVGAGDSMVAGFLAGWLKYGTYDKALSLGSAAGAATSFCENIAAREEIYGVLNVLLKSQEETV